MHDNPLSFLGISYDLCVARAFPPHGFSHPLFKGYISNPIVRTYLWPPQMLCSSRAPPGSPREDNREGPWPSLMQQHVIAPSIASRFQSTMITHIKLSCM